MKRPNILIQNLEFFSENTKMTDDPSAMPIGQRLFSSRVGLIEALQESEKHELLLAATKKRLHEEVQGMNVENFIMGESRRSVEKFQSFESWGALDLDARMALVSNVAGLPTAFEDGALPAKQFDLLILKAQILLLNESSGFSAFQKKVILFASQLEALSNIPTVAKEMELIIDIQTDEFWQDITVEMLEDVRKRLRGLVDLIEAEERMIIITDFEDTQTAV